MQPRSHRPSVVNASTSSAWSDLGTVSVKSSQADEDVSASTPISFASSWLALALDPVAMTSPYTAVEASVAPQPPQRSELDDDFDELFQKSSGSESFPILNLRAGVADADRRYATFTVYSKPSKRTAPSDQSPEKIRRIERVAELLAKPQCPFHLVAFP